jgi:hypothetical protein
VRTKAGHGDSSGRPGGAYEGGSPHHGSAGRRAQGFDAYIEGIPDYRIWPAPANLTDKVVRLQRTVIGSVIDRNIKHGTRMKKARRRDTDAGAADIIDYAQILLAVIKL